MKIKIWITLFVIPYTCLSLFCSCSKENNNTPVVNPHLPVVSTTSPISVFFDRATCGGRITSEGGGPVIESGICWSTKSNPTDKDNLFISKSTFGSFTIFLKGLKSNTTYFLRAYAINGYGIAYGNEISFKTTDPATVLDVDGNIYHTITIGTQVWMVENLNVTKYRNGDPLIQLNYLTNWTQLKSGACCVYNNYEENAKTYGRLYNWYAVNDIRNIAPIGWHVASDAEWTTLTNYLGGESIAALKLKEPGVSHWISNGNSEWDWEGVTNESGFTAIGSGFNDGSYWNLIHCGYWWTATGNNSSAFVRNMYADYKNVMRSENSSLWYGYSVRCIKD